MESKSCLPCIDITEICQIIMSPQAEFWYAGGMHRGCLVWSTHLLALLSLICFELKITCLY